MAMKTTALKSLLTLLRLLQLLSSIVILAIYSYFLAVQRKHRLYKAPWVKAVEAISGASVLWTLIALLATVFVGGAAAFGFPALILDLLFFGAFIAVTVLTRSGRQNCRGYVSTPLGSGDARTNSVVTRPANSGFRPNLYRTCRLQKAVFAVAIILFVLFLISAVLQLLLVKANKKDKRYGPSPANDYTSGSARRGGLFGGGKKNATRDAELATTGTAVGTTTGTLEAEKHHHGLNSSNAHNIRPSHETGYTGSTVSPDVVAYNNGVTNKTIHGGVPVVPADQYSHTPARY